MVGRIVEYLKWKSEGVMDAVTSDDVEDDKMHKEVNRDKTGGWFQKRRDAYQMHVFFNDETDGDRESVTTHRIKSRQNEHCHRLA